jgi:hypothetical protein
LKLEDVVAVIAQGLVLSQGRDVSDIVTVMRTDLSTRTMIYVPERFLDLTSGGAAMMDRDRYDEIRTGSTAAYEALKVSLCSSVN